MPAMRPDKTICAEQELRSVAGQRQIDQTTYRAGVKRYMIWADMLEAVIERLNASRKFHIPNVHLLFRAKYISTRRALSFL